MRRSPRLRCVGSGSPAPPGSGCALYRLSWRHRCAMASGICWNLVFNYCRLHAARCELGRLKSINDTIVILLSPIDYDLSLLSAIPSHTTYVHGLLPRVL